MKAIPEVDRKAYELAKSYLPSQKITGVTQALIEKYQNLSSLRPKPTSRNELYERLLRSAQNAGMKSSVIGDSIGGVDKLSSVLYDFSPKLVLANYEDDWEAVLDRIIKELNHEVRFVKHHEAFGHSIARQLFRLPDSLSSSIQPISSLNGLTFLIRMQEHAQVCRCFWIVK